MSQNIDKYFDSYMPVKTFTKATYTHPKGGTWFVIWYNLHPDTGKLTRIRKTFNLNRIEDVKERKAIAANIVTTINAALMAGWNYFSSEELPVETAAEETITLEKAFREALAVKLIGNAIPSQRSFNSIASLFLQWLKENNLHFIPAKDFKSRDFQQYITQRHQAGKGNRNINAHINLVKAVFTKMVRPLEIIDRNPLEGFALLSKSDSNLFDPLTQKELSEVATLLREKDAHFFAFTQFIYYANIRPYHIGGIRRSQIDFENNIIYIQGDNTKSKRKAQKQLLTPLKNQLLALGIDTIPPNHYIFSYNFQPGHEKIATQNKRATVRWKELVIDGMSIPKKMYALKHTFGSLYLSENENVDTAWLQAQMEHSSLAETETYVSKRRTKKIDESKVNLPEY